MRTSADNSKYEREVRVPIDNTSEIGERRTKRDRIQQIDRQADQRENPTDRQTDKNKQNPTDRPKIERIQQIDRQNLTDRQTESNR